MSNEDDLLFIDDDESELIDEISLDSKSSFKVLIVDDDEEVHSITRFALEDSEFLGSSLTFVSAYSAAEAKVVLEEHNDVALIFLDVVMEYDDAGLKLAKYIREELDNWIVRIVLRTGQPGQAPEKDVITNYDINDYKSKTELTSSRLFTTTLASLRTYSQLRAVELNRLGLEKILDASSSLFKFRSMGEFAQGVVRQISSFIENDSHGVLLCAMSEPGQENDLNSIQVIAGTENMEATPGKPISSVLSTDSCQVIQKALLTDTNIYNEHDYAIIFRTHTQATTLVYLSGIDPLSKHDIKLLEVFCSKIAIGFDNINYYDELQYKNTHDLLTGMFNRSAFIDKVDSHKKQLQLVNFNTVMESAAYKEPVFPCLVVVGIDRFRDINNDLGYLAGDEFLIEIAMRLRDFFSKKDDIIFSRLGADEFAAYVPEGNQIYKHIEDLRYELTLSATIKDEEIIPSVSIGYLAIKNLNRPCYDLLAETENALLSAKNLGGNRCIEAKVDTVQQNAPTRLALTRDLTHALNRDELKLYYQPIIVGKTGKLAGFEALLRWHHPDRGVITPGNFLGLIETTDLMIRIGDWALEESMNQAKTWNQMLEDRDDMDLSLSVNVSARQIMVSDLETQIKNFINSHNISAHGLRLEITESLIMEDLDAAIDVLNTLKELGVTLSLDDFGTGYSSMNYLNRLPFDILKLDRSFISSLLQDTHAEPIINFIIRLAHEMDIHVVAEGVETQQQYETLVRLDCDYLQGYLFGHPMPVQKATDFILNYDAKQFHL